MFRDLVMGLDTEVPLNNNKVATAINFDNAATTPPLVTVMEAIINFAPWYSSVNRGGGYKSEVCSKFFEDSRRLVLDFVNADPKQNTVIYVKNSTEAVNKLAYRMYRPKKTKEIVLTTLMEHHSNDLPWRKYFKVKHIKTDSNGRLLLKDLHKKLRVYGNRVRLVAVSGASNVTGYLNPIHKIAKAAHLHRVPILVDGAQLVPHIPVNMRGNSAAESIDFMVFSGHKMYAPFGTGVLIGPKRFFASGTPAHPGGGTVDLVTRKYVKWTEPPHNEEGGTPNLMGVLALATAIQTLTSIGMANVAKHEQQLTEYALAKLRTIPNIHIYGDSLGSPDRLSIISFNLRGILHAELARYLANDIGIAVRSGCFCAHPYVQKLLNIPRSELLKRISQPDLPYPGMVRISFGIYNTKAEIDILIKALQDLSH